MLQYFVRRIVTLFFTLVIASLVYVVGMLIWTASTRPAVEAKANIVKENHKKVVDFINNEVNECGNADETKKTKWGDPCNGEWIAEKVFALKPFKNINDLFSKMILQYENCEEEYILQILNSHPELVVEKKLTKDSLKEQSGVNLNQCSIDEFEEFQKLNIEYKKKFGFPFIIAVKGKNKIDILKNFRQRILDDVKSEFQEAKKQVAGWSAMAGRYASGQ